jgi:hypothetical protein
VDEHSRALYESVVAAVPGWIERSISHVLAQTGTEGGPDLAKAVTEAGLRAEAQVGPALMALLDADIDEQHTTPLSIVRGAVRQATEILQGAGVAPPARDEARRRLFPDDLYDLSPASLAEVDPALTEPGLMWGAHKAMAHLQRHGSP